MKLLGLIRTLTFSFSTTDSLLMLYFFALVRSKLEYASEAWNSVTITDSNKLERLQRKFAALCHKRFFRDVEYHYDNILEKLNLQTLYIRRRHFDAMF
jgi:myo-inositol catabolism protein IolC